MPLDYWRVLLCVHQIDGIVSFRDFDFHLEAPYFQNLLYVHEHGLSISLEMYLATARKDLTGSDYLS